MDQSLGKELHFNLLYRSSAARGARVQEQYKPRPAGRQKDLDHPPENRMGERAIHRFQSSTPEDWRT